jgi:hypothetical protein
MMPQKILKKFTLIQKGMKNSSLVLVFIWPCWFGHEEASNYPHDFFKFHSCQVSAKRLKEALDASEIETKHVKEAKKTIFFRLLIQ